MAKKDFIVTARVDNYQPGDRLTLEVGDDGLPVSDLYRVRVRLDTGKDDRELEAPAGGKDAVKAAKAEAAKIVEAAKAEAAKIIDEATAEAAKMLGGNGQ